MTIEQILAAFGEYAERVSQAVARRLGVNWAEASPDTRSRISAAVRDTAAARRLGRTEFGGLEAMASAAIDGLAAYTEKASKQQSVDSVAQPEPKTKRKVR